MSRPTTIHIAYPIQEGPWGGGNQFLADLKKQWMSQDVYEEDPAKAEMILFNAHHHPQEVLRLRRLYPEKTFVHRLAGILSTQRGVLGHQTDVFTQALSRFVSDGLIFQSAWARGRWLKLGLPENLPHVIIPNAPDAKIFFKKDDSLCGEKVRLICTSWSSNPAKGFEVLRYLDEQLDFQRFSFSFIGKCPLWFKNIQVSPPIAKKDLALRLRQHDIFLTASENDACSNSLVEALHTGLVVVAKNSGGHPELVKEKGLLFENEKDVLGVLGRAVEQFQQISLRPLHLKNMEQAAAEYYRFCEHVHRHQKPVRRDPFSLKETKVRALLAWERAYARTHWSLHKVLHSRPRLFASSGGSSTLSFIC